ncbi:MAG TPA: hypothetical protein VFA83_12995 [Acidimicrobiales bacterium]|nr:hypothetical protein [Acidimicrobiales bacterium]
MTKRVIASIGAVLLAAGMFGGVAARADDSTNLSSFDLVTSAAALRWQVDLKASPVPAEHTVDLSMPLSRAELSAGPAGHALASTAWPGDTLAKACSAAPQVPCYTIDAETFSPQGPADASNTQIAGAEMTAHSKDLLSTAVARYTPQGGPGVSFGPMSATSHSEAKTAQAITESTSVLSNVDLGGGVVHIDSITSTAKVVTDGTKATVTGGTILTGATVGGVPVTIDQDGVHVATVDGGGNPLNQVLDAGVAAALQTAGISLSLPGPIKKVADAEGDIVATGLIASLDDSPLVKLIPAGTGLPADPTGKTTIVLGQAAATASAAGAFGDLTSSVSDAGSAAGSDSGSGGGVLGATVGSLDTSGGSALSPSGGALPASTTPTANLNGATRASAVGGTPVSIGLVIGVLLLAALGAVGLRRYATAVLEPAPVTTCALESKRE